MDAQFYGSGVVGQDSHTYGFVHLLDSFQNGLDFGYAEDPAALVRCHYDERANTLYVLDACYFHGLTNDLLAQEVMNLCGRDVVVCDSAEPKSIAELRQYGVTAIPAEKGKDSVNFGIQWLQKLNIVVNTNLPELVNELTVYKWDEDKDGNVLPKPIDRDNHLIDAIRYALFREMGWGARRGGNIRMPLAGAM